MWYVLTLSFCHDIEYCKVQQLTPTSALLFGAIGVNVALKDCFYEIDTSNHIGGILQLRKFIFFPEYFSRMY